VPENIEMPVVHGPQQALGLSFLCSGRTGNGAPDTPTLTARRDLYCLVGRIPVRQMG
jgi:hypothetical protein